MNLHLYKCNSYYWRVNMEKIGIIKEIDKLGRVLIPKELRGRYGYDGEVELVAAAHGVLIKSPDYVLIKIEKTPDMY